MYLSNSAVSSYKKGKVKLILGDLFPECMPEDGEVVVGVFSAGGELAGARRETEERC